MSGCQLAKQEWNSIRMNPGVRKSGCNITELVLLNIIRKKDEREMAWRVNVVKLGAENLFPLLGALKERQNMKENITWAEAGGADTMTRVCQECRGTQAVLLESPRIRLPPHVSCHARVFPSPTVRHQERKRCTRLGMKLPKKSPHSSCGWTVKTKE